MKNSLFLFLLVFTLLFSFSKNASAQAGKISEENLAKLKTLEDTVSFLSYLVINDSLPENRFASTKKLITTLVGALKIENSFHYPFERVKAVSIQYPADSTFRVFTWQLYVDVDEYRYYGAIQMNSPELKLFPLIDRSTEVHALEQETLSPEKWYGALYYNIRQFDDANGERKYLLFGFDGYSLFNKRKLIEVLSFQDGEAIFGAPVFVSQNEETGEVSTKNRVVQEYSSEVSCKLNFDEVYDIVMFDHLIMAGGNYGQGPTMVPDGSYEGYRLEGGKWMWVEKVFDQKSEEAPRPEPVLDTREKDNIIGGKKKKN